MPNNKQRPKSQRGKPWDKEKVVELLKPYFQRGNSVREACLCAGIPHSTFETWLGKDNELRAKIGIWQNEMSEKARDNWRDKIVAGDYPASKDWLERKKKKEFSLRYETTGKDGEPLQVDLNTILHQDDITKPIDEGGSDNL